MANSFLELQSYFIKFSPNPNVEALISEDLTKIKQSNDNNNKKKNDNKKNNDNSGINNSSSNLYDIHQLVSHKFKYLNSPIRS